MPLGIIYTFPAGIKIDDALRVPALGLGPHHQDQIVAYNLHVELYRRLSDSSDARGDYANHPSVLIPVRTIILSSSENPPNLFSPRDEATHLMSQRKFEAAAPLCLQACKIMGYPSLGFPGLPGREIRSEKFRSMHHGEIALYAQAAGNLARCHFERKMYSPVCLAPEQFIQHF